MTDTASASELQVWPGQPYPLGATFDGTAKNAAWLGEDVQSVKKLAPTME